MSDGDKQYVPYFRLQLQRELYGRKLKRPIWNDIIEYQSYIILYTFHMGIEINRITSHFFVLSPSTVQADTDGRDLIFYCEQSIFCAILLR